MATHIVLNTHKKAQLGNQYQETKLTSVRTSFQLPPAVAKKLPFENGRRKKEPAVLCDMFYLHCRCRHPSYRLLVAVVPTKSTGYPGEKSRVKKLERIIFNLNGVLWHLFSYDLYAFIKKYVIFGFLSVYIPWKIT